MSEEVEHTAADHPELDDPEFLKALVHSLVHRVELLETLLAGAEKADVTSALK